MSAEQGKARVLFVAEAATLAHVARPLALSTFLDPGKYEIAFSCDPRCTWLLQNFPGRFLPLSSISSEQFLDALTRGKPLYDDETLRRYVHDDLEILDELKPQVVIGDFRLSLSISARLRGIKYIAVSNCYWSPYWRPPRYVVPNLKPLTTLFPLPLADALFRLGRHIGFALHCRPLNRTRRIHGLPSLGSDLRRVYTDADYVLYADIPDLFPEARLPPHHRFIGPIIWSPPVPRPDWWDQVPGEKPIVYLTLGSSGQAELLPAILRSLGHLDITVIAATAGSTLAGAAPPNTYVAGYLPGSEAAARSGVVICNGGSPTSQQALAAGVPVIGIASNLDQFLNMDTLVRAGAGAIMRADRFSGQALATLVTNVVEGSAHAAAARKIAATIAAYDTASQFAAALDAVLAT
jgi:UDP:flavonoid glycosyltransferase YjiC (YdhE family)